MDQPGKRAQREFDRRRFLAGAAGAAALAGGAASAQAQGRSFPPLPGAWREAEILPLWPDGPPSGGFVAQALPAGAPEIFVRNVERPVLHLFRPARANGRAVLILPGGSYTFVSILNEGIEIAQDLAAQGYTAFVLTYRLPGEGWADRSNVPLQDAQRAMRVIRANAARLGLDPAQVAALGFSAGGHLAATLATGFAEPVYAARDAADRLDPRPLAAGLIYPVIRMTPPDGHAESTLRLLGPAPAPELVARRSPAEHVGAQTPPLFLVHALDDPAVPPANSLAMLQAMRDAHRPVEAHLFETGGHGFGRGPADRPNGHWLPLFGAWLEQHAASAAS